MRLQFVGCGDAFGSGGRFNTCFHLTGQRTNALIDCGASSMIALKKLGIRANDIQVILITHFHADHFGGIPFFLLDAQFFAKRTEPLVIAGPPGLPRWFERVMETSFPGSSTTKTRFDLTLRELAAGESAEIAGMRVTPQTVEHGPGGPFFALRVEAEGKSVAYTGDTEWTESLVAAAHDVDLFVAEAYFRDKQVKTHLDLATLERHLPRIRPRKLVLTHMSDDMLARLGTLGYETAEDGKVVEF